VAAALLSGGDWRGNVHEQQRKAQRKVMGKLYAEIDARMREFVAAQRLFFIATAPSGDGGHVNCSPKGQDTLRVIGPTTVAYLDYTGSGVETIAHLRQNGRVVVMFCAFEGPPRIVRFHGRGEAFEPGQQGFDALAAHFGPLPALGVRAIVKIEVTRISDSCGYGVPLFRYEGERDQMQRWAERKGAEGIDAYKKEKNAESIDGLPGLSFAGESS